MESLVNYSSEDEKEDSHYSKMADRSSGRGRKGDYGSKNGSNGNSSRTERRDESSDRRHKKHYSSSERSSSSFQRDNNRDRYAHSRDMREPREYNNGQQRYENKSKHERFNQRQERPYRNDEYNKRDRGRGEDRYGNRHASTSTYGNSSRDNRTPRYSGGGGNNYDNSRSRQYKSYRGDDEHQERNNERFASSRSDRHRQQQSKYISRSRRSHSKSRSHSRSKSRSRSRSVSKERRSPTNTERSTPLSRSAYDSEHSPAREEPIRKTYQRDIAAEESVRHIAPLMSLPLSDTAPKQPNLIAVTGVASNLNNTDPPAVIQLPSYYNPSVINPTKYAEQVQKRKLLWGAKKSEDTSAKWGNAHFSQDTDGKVASKFMRLMGIKNAEAGPTSSVAAAPPPSHDEGKPAVAPDVKSREAMFNSMEQQYEVARQATHTMRGVGLGFGSSRPY